MENNSINIVIILCLFLIFLTDFLKNRDYLKDKRYLLAGIISNIFLLLFLIFFILDIGEITLYIVLGLGIIPGIFFEILKFRKIRNENFLKILPGIMAILIMVYLVFRVLFF